MIRDNKEVVLVTAAATLGIMIIIYFLYRCCCCCCYKRENGYEKISEGSMDVKQHDLELGNAKFRRRSDDCTNRQKKAAGDITPTTTPSTSNRQRNPLRKSFTSGHIVEVPAVAKVSSANSANAFVKEIEEFVRHRDDFHALGFYYSVKLLERHILPPPRLKITSLREFIRRRPEFRMLTNLSAFKLVNLTPCREPNKQMYGKFQCVNVKCRLAWESLCTYCDHYQKCPNCEARVYPYEQVLLTAEMQAQYDANPIDENYIDYDEVAYVGRRDAFDPNMTVSPTKAHEKTHRQSITALQQTNSEQPAPEIHYSHAVPRTHIEPFRN